MLFGCWSGKDSPRGRTTNKGTVMLKEGEAAPEFTATDHTGSTVRLSDYAGTNVLLWFYPKADTPG